MKKMLWAKVKLAAVVGTVLTVGGGGGALAVRLAAAERATPPVILPATAAPAKAERKGPLARLPSAPGPHLEKVKALGDNQWVNLGSPAADPNWGKAPGRSWGAKMPFASDLRGAFLTGEGPHGFIKPDGYLMDDLWFYDINAHRWICVYPGMEAKNFTQRVKDKKLKIDDNGLLINKDGEPLPQHTMIHAYASVTYDPDTGRFAWMFGGSGGDYLNGLDSKGGTEGLNLLRAQPGKWNDPSKSYSPWFYDTVAGKFDCYVLAEKGPGVRAEFGSTMLYIDSRKQYFLPPQLFFDPAARKWISSRAKGPQPTGIDHSSCYDPKRDRVYMGGGGYNGVTKPVDNFFIYDVKTATWTKANPTGKFPLNFTSNGAFFNYDSVNDAVVLMKDWGKEIYVYNPETNAWAEPLTTPKGLGYDAGTGNGFYDPELNAFFCHFAGDGVPNGTMWAYRYKKAVAK